MTPMGARVVLSCPQGLTGVKVDVTHAGLAALLAMRKRRLRVEVARVLRPRSGVTQA